MVMLVGVCEGRDGNAPWNPSGIAGGLLIITLSLILAGGTAIACTVNDFAWGDQTNNPNFGKR